MEEFAGEDMVDIEDEDVFGLVDSLSAAVCSVRFEWLLLKKPRESPKEAQVPS